MTGLDIKRDRIMVDIACNDPDNGVFAGRAEQIVAAHQFLELEAIAYGRPPKFTELGDAIRVSRRKWPITGSKDWVGNWCWNGYWMEIKVAVQMLSWLQSAKLYRCTCGEERIYNLWNNKPRFDDDDRAFLDRMLGKPSTWKS